MNVYDELDEVFISEGLQAYADKFPNSVVVDLIANFDKEMVLKFLILYGGRQISVPKVDGIWRNYRDQVIEQTLDVKNNRVVRKKLSEYFKVMPRVITDSYARSKYVAKRLSTDAIDRVIETVYRKNTEKLRKYLRGTFSTKYGVKYYSAHDVYQNPEDRYLIAEALKIMKADCVDEIKNHPIFKSGDNRVKYAVEKILKQIEDNN